MSRNDREADMDQADDLLQRALLDAEACASVALKVSDLAAVRGPDRDLPRPPRPRHAADLRRPRRPRRRLGRRRAPSCCASPATSTSPTPRSRDEAEELYAEQARALRDAIVAADTVLAVWAGPLAAATGGDIADRALDRARRAPARPPPHAGRADRARAAHARRRRLRRAHARRGPPADGDRLRPAGPRPRLPALRRPRELPRGLRAARRRPRPPHRRSGSTTRRPRSSASWSSTATTSTAPADARRGRRAARAPRRVKMGA